MKREDAPPEYWTLYRIAYLIDACSTKIGELLKLKDDLYGVGLIELRDETTVMIDQEIDIKHWLQRTWDTLVHLPQYRTWSDYFEQ